MANTVTVPRVNSHVSNNCSIAPRNKISFERSSRELPSLDLAKFSKASGLDHLRQTLQRERESFIMGFRPYHKLQALSLT